MHRRQTALLTGGPTCPVAKMGGCEDMKFPWVSIVGGSAAHFEKHRQIGSFHQVGVNMILLIPCK